MLIKHHISIIYVNLETNLKRIETAVGILISLL
jgi:hypothetical protein